MPTGTGRPKSSCRFAKTDQLLGIAVPADKQVASLKGLGLENRARRYYLGDISDSNGARGPEA